MFTTFGSNYSQNKNQLTSLLSGEYKLWTKVSRLVFFKGLSSFATWGGREETGGSQYTG